MIIGNSRRGYHQGKQEGDSSTDHHHHHTINNSIEKLYPTAASSSSASRQWSAGLRNPRIVRVSRSFGGKDRHSKVCTIRGLRDRRIRLSVPTAIQLYDLQDRLGVSQPSKVIDWLIETTKLDIDKLPPLQIPHGFPQFLHPHHQQTVLLPPLPPPPPPHHQIQLSSSSLGALYDANFMDAVSRLKGIREDHERSGSVWERGKWVTKTNNEEDDTDGGIGGSSAQNLSPMTYNYNNNPSYSYHSGPSSNLSLFGSHGLFFPNNSNSQVDPAHNCGVQFQFPSNSSAATVLPSSLSGPYYAPYMNITNNTSTVGEIHEPTRVPMNQIQFLSSSSHHQAFTSSLVDSDHNQKQDTTDPS